MTSPPAALSIGLVIPFILTLIIAVFDTSFFERNDSFCWVRPDYIVYAVVIPIVLPIINGLMCSTFAIYKLFFQAKRGLASKETAHYDAEFWSKVVGLLIMQVAMGLPWVS
uniref:G_PROTEIN_RECEP_F1_2 domain-containing protein n=1 Tax=Caenorhabditis tropicalis TaxID=1561998 RepID=A0A1I7TYZ3_9PELO